MRRSYKVILFTIVVVLVINISSSVLAKDGISRGNEERINEICLEVKRMDISEEVNELIAEGIKKEDAEYYIMLNNLVRKLEAENIELLIDKDVEDIPDHEFLINKTYYREKILEGDKRALKKAMKSLDSLINGYEYAEKVISTFSDKAAFEIIYPDGSKISYDTRVKESSERAERERALQRKNKDSLENLRTLLKGYKKKDAYKPVKLGYEETIMDEGITYAYDNIGWREGEWSFESGLSFSKVYLYTEYQLGSDGTSIIKYARGGQSSYGIVNIANSTGGVISRPSSNGEEFPAEARNEVIFTVSGSFGATFLILSLAVEPGMNWTQYIIFRLYDSEKIDGEYAARYEWYAAEYK